jgi:hypothetical protein
MIPDMTPWSYPKSKNPIVATVETVMDSFLPDKPAKFGAMMVVKMGAAPEW